MTASHLTSNLSCPERDDSDGLPNKKIMEGGTLSF